MITLAVIQKDSNTDLYKYSYGLLISSVVALAAIFIVHYKDLIDFPFLCHHFDDIVQIQQISPTPVHENAPFYGQSTHFSVPIHENSHFYGQQKAVSKIGIQLTVSRGFYMVNLNLCASRKKQSLCNKSNLSYFFSPNTHHLTNGMCLSTSQISGERVNTAIVRMIYMYTGGS